jgi:SMI1-KNR4 cell-wall
MTDSIAAFVSRYKALGLTGTPAALHEVEALERQLGVVFPEAYKAFLLILGRDGGPDFVGSDCTIGEVPTLREGAERLLRAQGSPFRLPEQAVVFLMHQGYSFLFFVADGTVEDPPVFAYLEGDPGPIQKAESFSAWLAL